MTRKIVKGTIMKKNFTIPNVTKKAARVVTGLAIMANVIMSNPMVIFAATPTPAPTGTGIAGIDFGLGQLLGLFFGLVSLGGVFYLGKGLLDFFSALPDRDTGSMKQGALEAIAGLGIASIGAVITFIGITY